MTKVKICGITNAEDARFCAEQGADFLGFVFVRESPRYVEPEQAAEIISVHRVQTVGVFRDEAPATIRQIVERVGLDFVQLHGSESEETVRAIGVPVIKAFRVADALPPVATSAEWVMFDSGGGTGRTFDWDLIAGYNEKKFFLAGGITPGNVAEAIRAVRPDAIDLASGVESRPGVKDYVKVRMLFEQVRRA